MASGKLVCGIEVNGTGLRIVLVSPRPVPTVVHCEEIEIPPGEESRIGPIVARILERFGARRADIHLAFSPPHPAPARHQIFTAPKLRRPELLQVAMRELRRDGTLDPNNACFAVDPLDANAEAGKGRRYLLVALAREPVEVAALSLLESKLVVRTATTGTIGIMRATELADVPTTGVVALAQLDIRRSTLLVLDNGVPRFFRDIPTSFAKGGRDGTDDALIAQALARELDISLVFFAQQHRPKQVDTIMIVGDAEVADRVSEWLEDSQTYKVIRFGAGERLKTQPNAPASLLPYAAALGATLPTRRGAPSADLLPPELRGQPERVIATVAAAIATVLIVAWMMHLHALAAGLADKEEARLLSLHSQFSESQRQVGEESQIEEEASRADQWKIFLEQADLYHRKLGQLIYGLERTMPGRGHLTIATLGPSSGQKLSPIQLKKMGNLRLDLAGLMHASDLKVAEADVLKAFHVTETLTPEVLHSTLTPLVQVPSSNGSVDLPFQINMAILNPFPGPRR